MPPATAGIVTGISSGDFLPPTSTPFNSSSPDLHNPPLRFAVRPPSATQHYPEPHHPLLSSTTAGNPQTGPIETPLTSIASPFPDLRNHTIHSSQQPPTTYRSTPEIPPTVSHPPLPATHPLSISTPPNHKTPTLPLTQLVGNGGGVGTTGGTTDLPQPSALSKGKEVLFSSDAFPALPASHVPTTAPAPPPAPPVVPPLHVAALAGEEMGSPMASDAPSSSAIGDRT